MIDKIELNVDFQGMKVDGAKKAGPKPIKGPQINRSRKGTTLTPEEKAEKRAKVRKAKAKKAKTPDSKLENTTPTIDESYTEPKPDIVVVKPERIVETTPQPAPTPNPTVPISAPRPAMVGSTISTPIKLNGEDPYSLVERLYGEIGYFILAEQVVPTSPPIKLIQIKLDDSRCINLFIEI